MLKSVWLMILISVATMAAAMNAPADAYQSRRCSPWKTDLHFMTDEEVEVEFVLEKKEECSFSGAWTPLSMRVKWRGAWYRIREFCTERMRIYPGAVYMERDPRGIWVIVPFAPAGRDRTSEDRNWGIGVLVTEDRVSCMLDPWTIRENAGSKDG